MTKVKGEARLNQERPEDEITLYAKVRPRFTKATLDSTATAKLLHITKEMRDFMEKALDEGKELIVIGQKKRKGENDKECATIRFDGNTMYFWCSSDFEKVGEIRGDEGRAAFLDKLAIGNSVNVARLEVVSELVRKTAMAISSVEDEFGSVSDFEVSDAFMEVMTLIKERREFKKFMSKMLVDALKKGCEDCGKCSRSDDIIPSEDKEKARHYIR